METLDSYKPKEMLYEKAALDCWDFQVNLEFLEEIIRPYLNAISYDEWMSLNTNDSESEVAVLLSDMCGAVISTNSNLILEIINPLFFTSGHDLSCGNDVTVQGGCSNFKVMEEDIEACFGTSLNQYFVEALNLAEGSYKTLDELVRLFSAEITKKVNSSLAEVKGSTLSLNTCDSLKAESTLQLVSTIEKLFKEYVEVPYESYDEQVCPLCKSDICWCFDCGDAENVEEGSTEISGSGNREVTEHSELPDDLNPDPEPQLSDCSESNDVTSSHLIDTFSSCPPRPEYLINKTFLTVILAKLIDHIATKTRTSLENVDLDHLVYSVTGLSEGTLDLVSLRNVDSLHIPIYKDLCQKFRSKYVLQAAMESGDEAFDYAVSVVLISHLKKYKNSKNTRKPFNPKNLSVVFESRTPEPDREESSRKGSSVFESRTPEPDREESSRKGSSVFESRTPEPDREESSRKSSSVFESRTPEPDREESSRKGSSVFESRTPEPDREESSRKGSSVFESRTPEPDREERSKPTTPSPPKRSLCSRLRKKFSRWASNVVNFLKRSGQ